MILFFILGSEHHWPEGRVDCCGSGLAIEHQHRVPLDPVTPSGPDMRFNVDPVDDRCESVPVFDPRPGRQILHFLGSHASMRSRPTVVRPKTACRQRLDLTFQLLILSFSIRFYSFFSDVYLYPTRSICNINSRESNGFLNYFHQALGSPTGSSGTGPVTRLPWTCLDRGPEFKQGLDLWA